MSSSVITFEQIKDVRQKAFRLGFLHDVYRILEEKELYHPKNKFSRIAVSLVPELHLVSPNTQPPRTREPFREAWMDWSVVREGDYLVGPEGTMFIITVEPLKPVLVVMTNTVITLMNKDKTVLFSGFPSYLLSDVSQTEFEVLLPRILKIEPRPEDIIVNDSQECFGVHKAELTETIWKLSCFKQ